MNEFFGIAVSIIDLILYRMFHELDYLCFKIFLQFFATLSFDD